MSEQPVVHRSPVDQEGAFVNAYLVETAAAVVAVDSLPTVSDSTGCAKRWNGSVSPCTRCCSRTRIPTTTQASHNSSPLTMYQARTAIPG
jgi:hypothetical protein